MTDLNLGSAGAALVGSSVVWFPMYYVFGDVALVIGSVLVTLGFVAIGAASSGGDGE